MEDEVCKIREMINLQASLRQDNEILRREVGELNSQMNDVLSSWHSPEEFAILKKEKEEAELGVAAHRRQLEENSVRFEQEVKEAKQAREGAVDKINFLEERMNEFARGMASKVKQVARTNLMRFWSKERLSFTQTFFRLFEIAVYMSKTMKQDILSQVFLRECRHAHASSVRVLWAWRFGAAMALNDRKEMKLEETRRHYNKLVVQYARGTLQAVLQAWRHVIERSNESLESKRRAMERQEREEQSAATARKAQIFWAWHVLTMT
uniref:Uncharacterized protein n=1 Tax=Hanusia phi TaxID=3032 RepID=A0A7S0HF79_9CRYP|mmetsp:Transcript_19038/g.43668  ORF Transcript_19038/g.43668 Transcript_19038/m.43668 type:complete len:266 (+) Transcript_19038:2-799(+)